jgi:hypothetical protein
MKKQDMALLIEVEDTLNDMDNALEQLTGYGHANGEFVKLDNVFNVIQNNSHKYYADKAEDKTQLFMSILMGREKTPEERADILINGTVRLE